MNILEFQGVHLDDGDHAPVRGLDFAVGAGQKLFVFGKSGSGKSTLLKLAAGILEPDAGSVRLSAPAGCRLPLGYVAKEGGLLSNLSLLDNAVLPVVYHKVMDRSAAERRAHSLFVELGIEAHERRRPTEVGASVRLLVHVVRAMLAEPLLFVVEDAMSDVDAATGTRLNGLLERVCREGRSLLLGTTTLGQFADWEGSFLFLKGGKGVMFEDAQALRQTRDPDVRACLD